jgi:quinoprotein glucose dehydrogenase
MLTRAITSTLVIFLLCLGTSCSKQETTLPELIIPETVQTEPSSDDIQYIKWTPNVNVPDPVSISMDDQGRAYVTQTQRRKAQDLDIRNNRDWIPDDVGLNSVAEKSAFFKTQLSPETSAQNVERVEDYNKDGLHDWHDLSVIPEVIHLIEDTDKDGFADSSKVFYDDFKTEVTGIAAGVLWHEGDVYATVAPDVWKLRDTNGDDIPDEKEVIAHGFGIHIAYGGHDMHGLIVGPDGKIYWSIGDKGINVLSKEGKPFFYPNQGGVMRANPDGSDFEVFAHGLRNVQEPTFDAYGNWFGVDNDSDQEGETERFIYLVDGMDAGWRNDYQYRAGLYNPWMAEGMTIPPHEGQPAYILPTIRNYIDGPAGFVWNPGTALNDRYKDFFFLNGTMNGKQYAFQVEPDGASFKMINDHSIGEGLPLIGLTWGPDGALYTPDWGGGYPLNQTGAIWKLDTPGANRAIREEVQQIIGEGVEARSITDLQALLSHADQRIRLKAQFELVKRVDTEALIEASKGDHQLKRIHAIWGLGQLARKQDKAAIKLLLSLINDNDPEIQVQSIKMLGDLKPGNFDGKLLIPHLSSNYPRVRFQTGLSIGRQKVAEAFDAVIALIGQNNGKDRYLRHAGIVALEGIGGADTLIDHSSEEVRLSAVVALRRLKDPGVGTFLSDASERVVLEAARAIHDDFSIEEALPVLAKQLLSTDSNHEAFVRRLINANFRIGGVNEAYLVAEYAANSSHTRAMRIEALDALASWVTPPLLDRVDGRRRYYKSRPIAKISVAITGILEGMLDEDDPLIVGKTVAAANALSVRLSPDAMEKLLRNKQAPSSVRVEVLKSIQDPKTNTYALNSSDEGLRMTAAAFLARTDKKSASEYLIKRLTMSQSVSEQQQTLALLADLETEAADQAIRIQVQELVQGSVTPAVQLDIIEAATKRNMAEELAGFESSRPTDSSTAPFIETLEGGNAEAGKQITRTHLAAQCVRCHRFDQEDGSEIGPNLGRSLRDKNREYILRSLVDPGAEIAEGFGITTVTLKSGETVSAQLGKESPKGVELTLADGKKRFIKSSEIASRTEPISSMPPMGYIMTKREIRDVVEYLSTLK